MIEISWPSNVTARHTTNHLWPALAIVRAKRFFAIVVGEFIVFGARIGGILKSRKSRQSEMLFPLRALQPEARILPAHPDSIRESNPGFASLVALRFLAILTRESLTRQRTA